MTAPLVIHADGDIHISRPTYVDGDIEMLFWADHDADNNGTIWCDVDASINVMSENVDLTKFKAAKIEIAPKSNFTSGNI